jgi:hypothetical protein
MPKFQVGLVADGYSKTILVEAATRSDAIKLAREKHCAPRMIEVTPHPEWLGEVPDDADEDYEIHDDSWNRVHHDCDDCGLVLFEGPGEKDNDWPWQYASGDDGMYTNICYPCAMKRKEAGNYCAWYKHFYRDNPVCKDCPAGKCPKAQNAYYEKLGTCLKEALGFSRLAGAEARGRVLELLKVNEFGLAHDALLGAPEGPEMFKLHMKAAADLMKEGWM